MLAGYALTDEIVGFLGLHGEAAERAARYLRFLLAVQPLVMLEVVGIACFRGAGDTVAGLMVMTMVNVVNISLSWSLVTGIEALGVPELGWDGLAIGTSTSFALAGLLILALLIRGRSGLQLTRREFRPDRATMRRILHVGVPGGADQIAVVCCHLLYVRAINGLGELASSAHGVGVRIESISYLTGFAFHVAAQTLVGQYLGAGDPRRATRAVVTTFLVGGGLMIASGVVLILFPESLTRIFIAEDSEDKLHVIALASSLLPIVGVAMPALAVIAIVAGALRGAGDTRLPIMFTFVGLILVRLPGVYLLAYPEIHLPFLGITIAGWSLGVRGAWYAMTIDVCVRCVLLGGRFLQGGWKHVRV
jgi:putative MATE family efflux protein